MYFSNCIGGTATRSSRVQCSIDPPEWRGPLTPPLDWQNPPRRTSCIGSLPLGDHHQKRLLPCWLLKLLKLVEGLRSKVVGGGGAQVGLLPAPSLWLAGSSDIQSRSGGLGWWSGRCAEVIPPMSQSAPDSWPGSNPLNLQTPFTFYCLKLTGVRFFGPMPACYLYPGTEVQACFP